MSTDLPARSSPPFRKNTIELQHQDDISRGKHDESRATRELDADEHTKFIDDSGNNEHRPNKLSGKPQQSLSILQWFALLSLASGLILAICLTVVWASKSRAEYTSTKPTVVVAIYEAVKYRPWYLEVPDTWQLYRMCNDCGSKPTVDRYGLQDPVPTTTGREATAYLTWIIDHYENLPPYVLFLHGHDRSWHQPERAVDLIKAINLQAVEDEGFINIRCTTIDCDELDPKRMDEGPGYYNVTDLPAGDLVKEVNPIFALMTAYWKYLFDDILKTPPPKSFMSNSGSQFAVARSQIRRKPLEYYVRLRRPMLEESLKGFDQMLRRLAVAEWGLPPNRTEETLFGEMDVNYWSVGVLFEGSWHVVFGKDAHNCNSKESCRNHLFNGVFDCTRYHAEATAIDAVQDHDIGTCTVDDDTMAKSLEKQRSLLGIP